MPLVTYSFTHNRGLNPDSSHCLQRYYSLQLIDELTIITLYLYLHMTHNLIIADYVARPQSAFNTSL